MSDDDLPAGQCVCGRPLPEDSLSDWACSEPCQSAWLMHRASPGYPHPREIRARAEQAMLARTSPRTGEDQDLIVTSRYVRPGMIPTGTEINVDGDPYVRVGAHWQPAGMWTPLGDALGEAARYRRWCPTCRERQHTLLYPASDVQECATCGHQWEGRPLLGWVEARGEPWPGIRLLLSDGQRSTAMTFSPEEVQAAGVLAMADRLNRSWLRLERQLCGGYADVDQPTERQQRHATRQLRRAWHSCADLS